MKLQFVCPFWGQNQSTAQEFIEKVCEAGYSGIEINLPYDDSFVSDIQKLTQESNLIFIAQQWLPPANESFEDYRKRFLERINYLASLNPVMINSHTGKDFFHFEENCLLIEECFQITEKTGIPIVHETHRGRFPFSAQITRGYLDKYPQLKLNADFTHWCTVSESMLEDQPEALQQGIVHSSYLHARVGHTQSPQVANPFDPEWKEYLDTFTGWWQQIIHTARKAGQKDFYICPEFGPWPYMLNAFNSNEPVADQWDLNVQMKEYLSGRLK